MQHPEVFSPELDRKWAGIVRSDPQRVVGIFDLGQDSPTSARTQWGDTVEDIYYALEHVVNAIRTGVHSTTWQGLVRAGIVGRVCQCVSGRRKTMDTPLMALDSSGEEITLHSTYYAPLHILVMSSQTLGNIPSSVDKFVIEAYRTHWSSMVYRLWKDPQATSFPHPKLEAERIMIQSLLLRLAAAARSLTALKETLFGDEDYTLCLCIRYWELSVSHDSASGIRLLRTVFTIFPRRSERRSPNNGQDDARYRTGLRRILCTILLALRRFSIRSDATDALELLGRLFDAFIPVIPKRPRYDHLDFCRTLLRAVSLWRTMLNSLIGAVEEDIEDGGVVEGFTADGAKTFSPAMTVKAVMGWLRFVLGPLNDAFRDERKDFIRLLVGIGVFDALDIALPRFASRVDMSTSTTLLIMTLTQAIIVQPSLLYFIRPQLPRSRSIRALFDASYASSKSPSPPPTIPLSIIPLSSPETPDAKRIRPWFYWMRLESQHRVNKECMRTGCTEKRRKRCTDCRVMEYCAQECQKSDWKEHRLTCGMYVCLENVDGKVVGKDDLGFFEPPFRFRKQTA